MRPHGNHVHWGHSPCHHVSKQFQSHEGTPLLHEHFKEGVDSVQPMMPNYASPDDDLEDLAYLDASLMRTEASYPVEQRLQALQATMDPIGVQESPNQIIVSRYLRDIDERVYLSNIVHTNYGASIQDDPIFAPIDSDSHAVPFWLLHLRKQKLASDNNGWNHFTLGFEAELDLECQMSSAMSESEGDSPPPKTQPHMMELGQGDVPQSGQRVPLDTSGIYTQTDASHPDALIPAYGYQARIDEYPPFEREFSTSHLSSESSFPPGKYRYDILELSTRVTDSRRNLPRAISSAAPSSLQYTTQEDTETFVASSNTTSPPVQPAPTHAATHQQPRPLENNDRRSHRTSVKRKHARDSPHTEASQFNTPTTKSAISIKLNLPEPEHETEPEHKNKNKNKKNRAKRTAMTKPTELRYQTQDERHDENERQQAPNNLNLNTIPKPTPATVPPPPPSPSITSATTTQPHKQPSTTNKPRASPSSSDAAGCTTDPPIHASERSLRQNPTPSRKRRYVEEEEEEQLPTQRRGRKCSSGHRGRGAAQRRGGGV